MDLPDSPMLLVHDLSFRYPGIGDERGTLVHDGFSLSIEKGGVTVLFGAADAGKTTFARIVAGLVPRFSGGKLDGTILLKGLDIRASAPFELMEKVGLVSQDSDEQIFTTRCDTELAFALESLGVPRPQIVERVEASLRRMGLSAFRDRNPSTLSGGEKKRLLLACLGAIGPELWILDESLEELDQTWKAATLDYLEETARTVLALDSRWSPLLAGRGTHFVLLSKGRTACVATRSDDASFQQILSVSGILPRKKSRERPAAPAETCLKAEALRFRFPGTEGFALSIETLELARGEICALVGSNGSGKTTLGKILCGLLAPQSGGISLGGSAGFRAASTNELNRTVGYLFQNPDHQIYLPTVRDELALGLRRQGMSKSDIDRRVGEAAELFALPDVSAPPALMSYGARRRLQAATYYLLARPLLILDEVDSGLSYREVESLLDAIFAQAPGIVLITHDMSLATALSDRILVLDGGRLTGDFRPTQYAAWEALSNRETAS
jgi:energy-coupling factor transport system ATP-binding protein